MASFFNSHKYQKVASSEAAADNDWKMGYQYTTAPFTSYTNRSGRSDSTLSYSSVSSSDSHYEKLAPTAEELSFYDDDSKALTTAPKERRVRFIEKDLPSLPREASSRKPRRMSSRDGAYAWFAQRRYNNVDERLEDSMEKRTF